MLVSPPKQYKLPVVLSREEVRRILAEVRIALYRVCLTTIYSCGLRLSEARQLRVTDIDSSRMMLGSMVRETKTAMYHCLNGRWSCCVSCGEGTGRGNGCFPHPNPWRAGVGCASGLRLPSRFESLWRSETGSHLHAAPFLRNASSSKRA